MELVHLPQSAGPWALDDSLRASLAVAGVIGLVGGEDFGTGGLRMLNTALPLCWWSIYSLHEHRPPEMHASGSFEAPDRTAEAFRFYRQGLYLADQTFSAAREEVCHGAAALTHWRADEIPAKHRGAIYTRNALKERVSLVRQRGDGGLLAINLYRHERQLSFTDAEFDLLTVMGAPLLACVDLHMKAAQRERSCVLALEPSTELCLDADLLGALPRREREVCERLLRGWTYEGIATDLTISPATVKTYRDRAFDRLGIHHRNELFALALDQATQAALRMTTFGQTRSPTQATDAAAHCFYAPTRGSRHHVGAEISSWKEVE